MSGASGGSSGVLSTKALDPKCEYQWEQTCSTTFLKSLEILWNPMKSYEILWNLAKFSPWFRRWLGAAWSQIVDGIAEGSSSRRLRRRLRIKTIGNRLIRRPATVVNFFSHVEADMLKTLCFSHFSSLGCIFKASFCIAWANSKFRKCVFVEATLSFFCHVGKKVWNLTLEVTISMFSQSHAGQQLVYFSTLPQALRQPISISISICLTIYLYI